MGSLRGPDDLEGPQKNDLNRHMMNVFKKIRDGETECLVSMVTQTLVISMETLALL